MIRQAGIHTSRKATRHTHSDAHTYIHTYMHTYIPNNTHIHTYIHAASQSVRHAGIHYTQGHTTH